MSGCDEVGARRRRHAAVFIFESRGMVQVWPNSFQPLTRAVRRVSGLVTAPAPTGLEYYSAIVCSGLEQSSTLDAHSPPRESCADSDSSQEAEASQAPLRTCMGEVYPLASSMWSVHPIVKWSVHYKKCIRNTKKYILCICSVGYCGQLLLEKCCHRCCVCRQPSAKSY